MPHPALIKAGHAIARSRTGRRGIALTLAVIGAGLLLLISPVLALLVILLGGAGASADSGPGCPDPVQQELPVAGDVSELDDEQLGNARTIVQTGQQLDIPPYGWVIALSTAMQESRLINVDHGDDAGPDSRGLFQQRAPWGPEEDRMDPASATEFFFTGGAGGQPGLLDIAGWQDMAVTEAAQQVQHSAYPDAYAQHEPLARELVAQLGGEDTTGEDQCGDGSGMRCPASGSAAEQGLSPDGVRLLRCIADTFPEVETFGGVGDRPANSESDHPSGRAVDAMIPGWESQAGNDLGWQIAEWVREHAEQLGVKYIIFDAQIWSHEAGDTDWRAYEHPSGAADPTSAHRDHVHVSVYGNAAADDDTDTGPDGQVALPIDAGLYRLTATFGESGSSWESTHTGLDFAAPTTTPVRAVSDGQVSEISSGGAYGNLVKIDHGGGVESWYAHLHTSSMATGDEVDAGQQLGTVGMTGNTNGAHLHLEIRESGNPVDPDQWLSARGVDP